MQRGLVGSEMCIRDRVSTQSTWGITMAENLNNVKYLFSVPRRNAHPPLMQLEQKRKIITQLEHKKITLNKKLKELENYRDGKREEQAKGNFIKKIETSGEGSVKHILPQTNLIAGNSISMYSEKQIMRVRKAEKKKRNQLFMTPTPFIDPLRDFTKFQYSSNKPSLVSPDRRKPAMHTTPPKNLQNLSTVGNAQSKKFYFNGWVSPSKERKNVQLINFLDSKLSEVLQGKNSSRGRNSDKIEKNNFSKLNFRLAKSPGLLLPQSRGRKLTKQNSLYSQTIAPEQYRPQHSTPSLEISLKYEPSEHFSRNANIKSSDIDKNFHSERSMLLTLLLLFPMMKKISKMLFTLLKILKKWLKIDSFVMELF
eukprot:TRINITY_DN30346_c0_g1_i1.p1 TRINITY_DN30346_c0_g1~~TRINITY_DN30346_c0_g1_i1.p1  ORF type:complete len:367 (+),score=70.35 TRINITY_DN30346_c0_g1_i1:74-1174(+)